MVAMKGERVLVSRGDGSGYYMTRKAAEAFVKENSGFTIVETAESKPAAEDKAVRGPRKQATE